MGDLKTLLRSSPHLRLSLQHSNSLFHIRHGSNRVPRIPRHPWSQDLIKRQDGGTDLGTGEGCLTYSVVTKLWFGREWELWGDFRTVMLGCWLHGSHWSYPNDEVCCTRGSSQFGQFTSAYGLHNPCLPWQCVRYSSGLFVGVSEMKRFGSCVPLKIKTNSVRSISQTTTNYRCLNINISFWSCW
jgi:hypothetical protein